MTKGRRTPLCLVGWKEKQSFSSEINRTELLGSYLWGRTPNILADPSSLMMEQESIIKHPNKNLQQEFSSHLHAKLEASRRPIASESHKVKPEPSNNLQQGVY